MSKDYTAEEERRFVTDKDSDLYRKLELQISSCRNAREVKEVLRRLIHAVSKDGLSNKSGNILGSKAEAKLREIKQRRELEQGKSTGTQGGSMLELFRDGNRFGLVTDCPDEGSFTDEFTAALVAVVETSDETSDRVLKVNSYLRHYAEVVCKLRGYKTTVRTRQVIEAGEFSPGPAALEVKVDKGTISVPERAMA